MFGRRVSPLLVAVVLAGASTVVRGQQAGEVVDPLRKGIGGIPPSLSDVEWLSGRPIRKWERGTTYVVFLWSTWAHDVVRAARVMDTLHREHAGDDVEVIGLAINQRFGSMDPDRFLELRKGTMSFSVAGDPLDKVARAWDTAIGLPSPPFAVLIDKRGRIVWKGHPFDGVENALAAVLDGDRDRVDALIDERAQLHQRAAPLVETINKGHRQGRWEGVAEAVDELIALDEQYYGSYAEWKYRALLATGKWKQASVYGRQIVNGILANSPEKLDAIAWYIVSPNCPLEQRRRDVQLALTAARRAQAVSGGLDWSVLDTLARTEFLLGKHDEAIDLQARAVEAAITGEQRLALQQRLKEYVTQDLDAIDRLVASLGKG